MDGETVVPSSEAVPFCWALCEQSQRCCVLDTSSQLAWQHLSLAWVCSWLLGNWATRFR